MHCRFLLAQRQSDHDKGTANKFLAAVEANEIVSQHPELSRKQISQYAATEVTEADRHSSSLAPCTEPAERNGPHAAESKADDQWTVATTKLPENILPLA